MIKECLRQVGRLPLSSPYMESVSDELSKPEKIAKLPQHQILLHYHQNPHVMRHAIKTGGQQITHDLVQADFWNNHG